MNCPLCESQTVTTTPHLDSQENLFNCQVIRDHCPDIKNNKSCQYSDIFGQDVEKMRETVKLLKQAMETRKKLLEKL